MEQLVKFLPEVTIERVLIESGLVTIDLTFREELLQAGENWTADVNFLEIAELSLEFLSSEKEIKDKERGKKKEEKGIVFSKPLAEVISVVNYEPVSSVETKPDGTTIRNIAASIPINFIVEDNLGIDCELAINLSKLNSSVRKIIRKNKFQVVLLNGEFQFDRTQDFRVLNLFKQPLLPNIDLSSMFEEQSPVHIQRGSIFSELHTTPCLKGTAFWFGLNLKKLFQQKFKFPNVVNNNFFIDFLLEKQLQAPEVYIRKAGRTCDGLSFHYFENDAYEFGGELKEVKLQYKSQERAYHKFYSGVSSIMEDHKMMVRIEVPDYSVEYVFSIIQSLEKNLHNVLEIKQLVEMPGYYDYVTKKPVGLAPFLESFDVAQCVVDMYKAWILVSDEPLNMGGLLKLLDTKTISPESVAVVAESIQLLIGFLSSKLEVTTLDSAFSFAVPILSFEREYDISPEKWNNVGQTFVSKPSEDMIHISFTELIKRFDTEFKKYFKAEPLGEQNRFHTLSPVRFWSGEVEQNYSSEFANIFDFDNCNRVLIRALKEYFGLNISGNDTFDLKELLSLKGVQVDDSINILNFASAKDAAFESGFSPKPVSVSKYTPDSPVSVSPNVLTTLQPKKEKTTPSSNSLKPPSDSLKEFLVKLQVQLFVIQNLLNSTSQFEQIDDDVPIQIKALFQSFKEPSKTRYAFSTDEMKDLFKFYAFWMNFKQIGIIEYLDSFKSGPDGNQISQPIWKAFSPEAVANPGTYMFRIRPYYNSKFGIENLPMLDFPVFDTYFLVSRD